MLWQRPEKKIFAKSYNMQIRNHFHFFSFERPQMQIHFWQFQERKKVKFSISFLQYYLNENLYVSQFISCVTIQPKKQNKDILRILSKRKLANALNMYYFQYFIRSFGIIYLNIGDGPMICLKLRRRTKFYDSLQER